MKKSSKIKCLAFNLLKIKNQEIKHKLHILKVLEVMSNGNNNFYEQYFLNKMITLSSTKRKIAITPSV